MHTRYLPHRQGWAKVSLRYYGYSYYDNYNNDYHKVSLHSFILETYIAPLQEPTTQRRSQPSHGQKRRTSERCKIWKGGPSARNVAQRGDHSMLMDPQPKRPSLR